MNARTSRVAALLVLGVLVATMAAPAIAASKKSGSVVVGSYQVVGEKVLVEVTNTSKSTEAGYVSVEAVVQDGTATAAEAFTLTGGATALISVGFLSTVSGVIYLGIGDSDSPVL